MLQIKRFIEYFIYPTDAQLDCLL